MRSNTLKATYKAAALAVTLLLLAAGSSFAQVTVALNAQRTTTTLPDGNTVPMWGYSCNNAAAGVTANACSSLNQAAIGWAPVLITVPTGQSLTIQLTNSLPVPTSLVVVGQLAGGLGAPVKTPSPAHPPQTSTTWPVNAGATFTPPAQADRARSFVQEAAPAGVHTYSWGSLSPGTYLISTGTRPSIQGPMGLYGVLVVTAAPASGAAFTPGCAYPGTAAACIVPYDADAVLLFSEIDPVQNASADAVAALMPANNAAAVEAIETTKWNPTCGTAHTCYPPAVDYTPMYYLINGKSFDKTAPAASAIQLAQTASTGNVLVRFVNASPRMHVPSVVGLPMSLVAEDGNLLPEVVLASANNKPLSAKVQNEVFLAAGKVYDAVVNPVQAPAGTYSPAALPVFDRELSLTANNHLDSGMLAYLQLGNALPGTAGGVPAGVTIQAVADNFTVPVGATTFTGNVLTNDVGISNAAQNGTCAGTPGPYTPSSAPQTFPTASGGSVTLNPNGDFTYTPPAAGPTGDSFQYCGNGNSAYVATVSFNGAVKGNPPVASNLVFNSNIAQYFKTGGPGVLAGVTDPNNYPVTAQADPANPLPAWVTLNPNGSFTASGIPASGATFNFIAVNSQGTPSNSATVTINYAAGSGLTVNAQDAQSHASISDYKWIIEEDDSYTWPVGVTTPPGTPTLATNFHRSYMPVLADGCTGPISCESGQTVYNPQTQGHDQVAPVPMVMPGQVALDPSKHYYISILPGDAGDAFNHGGGLPQAIGGAINNLTKRRATYTADTGSDPGLTAGQYVTITGSDGSSITAFVATDTPTGFTFELGPAQGTVPPAPLTWSATRVFNPSTDCTFSAGQPAGNCGHTMGGSPIAPGQTSVTVNLEPNPLQPAQLSIIVFEDNSPTNGSIDGAEETRPGLGGFQIILNDVAGATGITTGQMTYDMFNMPLTNALVGTIDSATGLDACPAIPAQRRNGRVVPGTGVSPKNFLVGMIITCPTYEADGRTVSPLAGHALIKNLFPNRFDVLAHPGADREAAGEVWIQTSTLEGTHANDAFAKVGEPPYFQEFGSPGYHSFIGFINPAHIAAANARLHGNNTVTGKVTNLRMSRPSQEGLFDSTSHAALAQTVCYAGLNSSNGSGDNIAFAQCDGDGNFTLTGVPPGQYQLVIWDEWQDQILQYQNVTVPTGASNQTIALGDEPAFSWFQTLITQTYWDNGADNPGMAQVNVNIRFRDGQFAATSGTDSTGNATFYELFPLFNWYVVETDTTRYKGSKVNIINDAGGPADPANTVYGKSFGLSRDWSTAGVLNSKESFSLPSNLQVPGATYYPGTTVRNDPGSVVTEGFQAFISQPQIMEFAKKPYAVGENGGIIGHVAYNSTRPFDDPQIVNQNLWEPLVPNVTVNLYQEVPAADGTSTVALKLVDTATTSSWDDWANGMRADGVTPNMSCPGQDPADPFFNFTLGVANQYRCYDGFHNWNQIQPAPYDGRYQFPTTACKICTTPNPDSTAAVPLPNLLPAGKYVAEVVLPPGFEVVKEEDKNILIGDAYIAPVTQQFGGLGGIFILPDQASLTAYNSSNPNNPTNDLGRTSFGGFNVGEFQQNTPCVGQLHIVPDFMSISPGSGQVAPFAGASKHLCDRREVTLSDQMQAKADFFIFTKTPKAAKFTGIILDDLSSEFNTTKPDYGEKFAVPFLPVAFRDFNGIEVSRTYADQFGLFNGLVYSTWEVNPPNPTGYAPNMMVTCMNDPGPILDTRPGSSTSGQMITDPMYNPQYSNFCYTNAYMPGTTDYMDTPVLPIAAFAAGYNPVDCAYPDATPAIKRVDGDGQFGPYVNGAGSTLTITALGDVSVPNNAYSGPSTTNMGLANVATVTRHYGFGTQGAGSSVGLLTNGVLTPLSITGWTDTTITATIPAGAATGELVIVADDGTGHPGKKSVDTVTVTVGGGVAAYVTAPAQNANAAGLVHPIQDAIDAANPGDLIMIQAGNYPELVIMWKPVRLQGVGAASVIINAAKYPTQKLAQWRPRINCLFGLDSQGNTLTSPNGTCTADQLNAADPLTGQEITGGVVLLEPSVLGTEEGAGITVLAKNLPQNSCGKNVKGSAANFLCAPSRIDGVSITGGDSGGGIYVNGWAHGLEIANNRIYGNAGVYHGGIRIGQPYLEGLTGLGPFNFDNNVKIHHNSITENGTAESNTGEAGAGGGLSLCTGTDNYQVNYNFICGNFTVGDGGGIGHIGLSQNGTIANNWVLFNQTFIQSGTTSGGGIAIEGEPALGTTQSLGTGNVTVDSNLILGNSAQGGHGGGLRLQDVNGNDVATNPMNPGTGWWKVAVTNNIIVDNVAGWAGGGVSLMDTVNAQIVNNTIVSNDSTATAGAVIAVGPGGTQSANQPAGLSAEPHGAVFATAFGPNTVCPAAMPNCNVFSNPYLENDIIYQNRTFRFMVTSGPGSGANPGSPATTTLVPTLVQTAAGQCPSGATYWDLGVLGQPQSSPAFAMSPTFSVLTPGGSNLIYTGNNNQLADPLLVSQYCNGSRANPGIPDSTPPNPPFIFQVAGAEDEGGNWVDLRYGPLSLSDSSILKGTAGYGVALGDYRVCGGAGSPAALCTSKSPAIDTGSANIAPNHDIFGTLRPQGPGFDIGAYEWPQAGTGQVGVAPTSLSFPLTRVYTYSNSEPLTVTNTATGPNAGALMISSITISGMPDGYVDFIQNNNCVNVVLNPGAQCTINVSFGPYRHMLRTGTLIINSNAMNPVVQVGLSGTAYQVTYNPNALNFGRLRVGQQAVRAVTVNNWGIDPVNFAAIISNVVPVTPVPMYTIIGNTCSPVIAAVPTGTAVFPPANYSPVTCTVTVALRPVEVDPITGTLTLTWNDPNPPSPAVIPLSGTSTSGVLVNPAAIAFPNTNVGASSGIRNVNVNNTTAASVAIGAPAITANFTIVGNTCPANLGPGLGCVISIRFVPSTTGPLIGTLTVNDAADPLGQIVNLSGTGTQPIINVSPGAFDFGAVTRGISFALAPTTTFTVTNNGTGPLTAMTRTMSGSTDFGIAPLLSTCGFALNPGANCTITVRFMPRLVDASGVQVNGTLSVGGATIINPTTATLSGTPQ